ncbi:sugar transport protein MST1-like [Phragmites australis]|uniref:sugar transport protein MST1-like n=1 Tax=Phragmites australis TaxID=29695 RepID=UPI002D775FAB|nr:sugar transport protein MST1-like [Phragmites australis]
MRRVAGDAPQPSFLRLQTRPKPKLCKPAAKPRKQNLQPLPQRTPEYATAVSSAMAREGFAAADGGRVHNYSEGMTVSVAAICLMAASCGLIYGYEVGVAGGVTQMESFLKKFFPAVLSGMKSANHDAYCKYDNQLLTAFTSSMYIASSLSSLAASRVTRSVGRQAIMLIGGALFLVGSIVNAGAVNVAMLIIGQMLLGFGVGSTSQAAPLYLAEASPARWRGAFTMAYHIFLCTGSVVANVVNYFTNGIPDWGWRISLGIAAVPAIIVVVGALLVMDTPSSLVLRGQLDKARASLQRIRGSNVNIEAEFRDIVCAVDEARRNEEGAFKRLRNKGYRPYAVMMVAIPVFFQFTGMVVVFVFAPVLFRTVGFGSQKAILGSVIINLVTLCAVVTSTFVVDCYGRRFLFLAGGISMILFQVAVSWLLAEHLGKNHNAVATVARNYAAAVLVLLCLYTFSLGLSWDPLKWVILSEIHPVDTRSVGQAISMSIAFVLYFVQTQVFTAMLCHLKYAIFLFYAGWVVAMTAFVAAFLPETKGVPLEAMRAVWARHWYWRRFVQEAN